MPISNTDVENVMPMLAEALLPPWLAGLLISGAVAAMMSTADSQLLVSTSAIGEDLGVQVSKKDDKLLNSRIITILLGIFAYLVAMYSEWSGKTIFSIVSFAWSGLGSSFGPALLLAMKTSRIQDLLDKNKFYSLAIDQGTSLKNLIKENNTDSLESITFDCSDKASVQDDILNSLSAIDLFQSKKIIIIKNINKVSKKNKDLFINALSNNENSNIIICITLYNY